MRILHGAGGALLIPNSSVVLTDAFPKDERGLALGINNLAAIRGAFIGLIHLPVVKANFFTGKSYFPHFISSAFSKEPDQAFYFAFGTSFITVIASTLRGEKYHDGEGENERVARDDAFATGER